MQTPLIRKRSLFLVPAVVLAASGCSGSPPAADPVGGATTDPADPPTPVLPSGTSLFLELVTPAGAPVHRARVTLFGQDPGNPDGGDSSPMPSERVADGAGHLLLEDLIPGRVIARADAPGHAPASVVVDLDDGVHAGARVTMLPLAPPIVFQAREGAVLRRGDVRVDVPPDAFVGPDGEPVTGLVEATLTPFDPSRGLDGLPWPLAGLRLPASGGGEVRLETLYMADISVWQNGRSLQLAPGKTARIEFVLPETFGGQKMSEVFAPGDQVPSWYYDFAAGAWREEAVGAIVAAAEPGRLAWLVDVEHFSPHNCDVPVPPPKLTCVLVTVADKLNNPLPGVHVVLEGQIGSDGFTGADGQLCLLGRVGDHVTIYAGQQNNPLSELYELDLQAKEAACGGADCLSLGIVVDGKGLECTPGEQIACPYGGDPLEEDVGQCVAGHDFCGVEGQWLGCAGEILPGEEACKTPNVDEDCDGEPDEAPADCQCNKGDGKQPCFPFDAVIRGECKPGFQECVDNHWDVCMEAVGPTQEDCGTLDKDEDCDGNAGCGDAVWSDGGFGADGIVDVAVGSQSSTYVVGRHTDALDLGNGVSLPAPGGPAGFLARYVGTTPTWVMSLGTGWTGELDIDADASGDLVLAGSYAGALPALGQNCPPAGGADVDIVVVRFDGVAGQCLAVRRFVHPGPQLATALAIDGNDRFVAGLYTGTPAIGNAPLPAPAAAQDAFVARLDDQLVVQWAEPLPIGLPADDRRGPAVAVNGAGVFVAGSFKGAPMYADDPLIADGASDLFLLRRDRQTGAQQWVKRFGNPGDEPGFVSLVADPAGDVVLSGVVLGEVSLNEDALVGQPGVRTVFVARLGSSGEHRWSTTLALADPHAQQGGQHLALDGASRLVLIGSTPQSDLFTVKYSPKGAVHWQHTYAAAGVQLGASVAIDRINQTDEITVVGAFDTDFTVDNQVLDIIEPDPVDGYLVRFNP